MRLRIIHGDALTSLRELESESVQCVMTSPPYWGLRDYGVEGQLGLEKSPDEYVVRLVDIFREVRRVLRGDGTLWLNLGDSYAGGQGKGSNGLKDAKQSTNRGTAFMVGKSAPIPRSLKPKDLIGIPWRVAFALQADGWWLRSDIIWSKPNPMPESVTDRPTKSHEYIFLLSKAERYYYDQYAIRESLSAPEKMGRSHTTSLAYSHDSGRAGDSGLINRAPLQNRNKRSVWVVPTQAFPDAHFATFPPDLVKPCILAGTSDRGACPECGSPWERVVERADVSQKREPAHVPNNSTTKVDSTGWQPATRATSVWKCSCEHICNPVPCVVLDPFAGSGTVGKVAIELGRNAILIEPNAEYVKMIERRTTTTIGLPL